MQKIMFWKFELTSTWTPSKSIGWRHSVKWSSLSILSCKMIQETGVERHICGLFLKKFCGLLLLSLLSMTLVLMQYFSLTYNSTLGEFELLAASLTDPRTRTAKTVFLPLLLPWPHRILILKCYAWIRCVLMKAFTRHLTRLYTISFRYNLGGPPPVNDVRLRTQSMPG